MIELQLLFGKQFTTFHVIGPLFLSDLVFGILGLISFILILKNGKGIPLNVPLLVLLGLSLVYLVYSVLFSIGPINYIVRHYALFLYLGISFIIFYSYVNEERSKMNLRFILLMGILAVIAQALTHFYYLFTKENYFSRLFTDFNYLTELIMPGLVIFEVWILIYLRKIWVRVLGIIFILDTAQAGNHIQILMMLMIITV